MPTLAIGMERRDLSLIWQMIERKPLCNDNYPAEGESRAVSSD
jgi:hypothetical protein